MLASWYVAWPHLPFTQCERECASLTPALHRTKQTNEVRISDDIHSSSSLLHMRPSHTHIYSHIHIYTHGQNIHANEPIARTPLVPDPPRGQRVALWDEPDAYISISHYTCSQVLAWPHSQSCPCPDSVTCVYDDFFVHTRALLAHEM